MRRDGCTPYNTAIPAASADLYAADPLRETHQARGVTTTYSTDIDTGTGAGATYGYSTGISYSDGTPSVTYSLFDRAGRHTQISDASGTRTLSYDAGLLDTETYSAPGTALDGVVIDRGYDAASRYESLDLLNLPSAASYSVDYGYDLLSSRLQTVSFSDGARTHTATYGYQDQSHQVNSLTQNNGSTDVLAVEKGYDAIGRLKTIAYKQPLQAHNLAFKYNAANQRTYATQGNGEFWLYGYDSLGQVTSARKHLADQTPIPGYWFTYGFDDIGNRQEAGRDQDANRDISYFSANALGGTSGANALNQYGSIQIPRVLGVLGTAAPAATITADGQAATRTDQHFQALLDYSGEAQPNAARFETIDIVGTLAGAGASGVDAIAEASDSFFLPASPVNIIYDDDGNLQDDGRWIYTWNGENRLITMEGKEVLSAVGAPRQKLEFAYDSQGRRFSKKVYDWAGASYSPLPTLHFLYLYDGWNLLAELEFDVGSSTFDVRSSYTWGLDVSGSQQGAGGVGGLLAVTDSTSSTAYPFYDGNGNVMGYYDATAGTLDAEFEYGPFGELIRATGSKKDDFSFRFSTKYEDAETGLLYYGFRYYDPVTGRWPSRDPIEEQGGLNLYGMVGNDSINQLDYLGKYDVPSSILFINEVTLNPETVEGANWYHREMSKPSGLVTKSYSSELEECVCAVDVDSGDVRWFPVINLTLNQFIWIDVTNFFNGGTLSGTYGHEQIHVQQGLDAVPDWVEAVDDYIFKNQGKRTKDDCETGWSFPALGNNIISAHDIGPGHALSYFPDGRSADYEPSGAVPNASGHYSRGSDEDIYTY